MFSFRLVCVWSLLVISRSFSVRSYSGGIGIFYVCIGRPPVNDICTEAPCTVKIWLVYFPLSFPPTMIFLFISSSCMIFVRDRVRTLVHVYRGVGGVFLLCNILQPAVFLFPPRQGVWGGTFFQSYAISISASSCFLRIILPTCCRSHVV